MTTDPLEVANEFHNLFSKVAQPDPKFKGKSSPPDALSQMLTSMVLIPTDGMN